MSRQDPGSESDGVEADAWVAANDERAMIESPRCKPALAQSLNQDKISRRGNSVGRWHGCWGFLFRGISPVMENKKDVIPCAIASTSDKVTGNSLSDDDDGLR
jgi:hypothetical protein